MSIRLENRYINLLPDNLNNRKVVSFKGSTNNVDSFETSSPDEKSTHLYLKKPSLAQKISRKVFDKIHKKFFKPACFHPEVAKAYDIKNFNNLEMCKFFDKKEKKLLLDCLYEDGNEFFITMNGQKPACLLCTENYDLKFTEKMNNFDYGKKFDFIYQKPWTDIFGNKIYSTYAVNREQVSDIIDKNRNVITSRLNLDENSSTKEIYASLFDCLNNGLSSKRDDYFHDLEGMILGFPKYNCMIFELEEQAGMNIEDRGNPEKFKKKMLKTLQGENSPYKNLPESEINELKKHINSIENIEQFYNGYYAFIKYCDEPEAMKKINTECYKFGETFSLDNFNQKFRGKG